MVGEERMDKQKVRYSLFGIFLLILLVALDQFTKYLAILFLKDRDCLELIPGAFELRYLENRGVAFGLFQGQRVGILLVGLLILLVLGYAYHKLPARKHFLPLHMLAIAMTAGAIGNMIDRFFRGFVVDFFYFSLIDFAIFNVADIYITVSAILLVLLVLFYYKDDDFSFLSRKKNQEKDTGKFHGDN